MQENSIGDDSILLRICFFAASKLLRFYFRLRLLHLLSA